MLISNSVCRSKVAPMLKTADLVVCLSFFPGFSSKLSMNIALSVQKTDQPPLLFQDDCVAADSVEVDLGDISGIFQLSNPVTATPPARQDLPSLAERHENQVNLGLGTSGNIALAIVKVQARARWRARNRQQMVKHMDLERFLLRCGFDGDGDRRLLLPSGEEVYPIHMAAVLGRHRFVRMLLNSQVDPEQETSCGRTALDLARLRARQDPDASLHQVIDLLRNPQQTMSMRSFLGFLEAEKETRETMETEVTESWVFEL